MNHQDQPPRRSRRTVLASGAALLVANILPEVAQAQTVTTPVPTAPTPPPARKVVAPNVPPGGYNILFILVDQEHFFEKWPFPVPAREWIKAHGITLKNHQGASCVCSPARSTIYTGQHIQRTGVFDNANSLWQRDMSTSVKTIGHRLSELGYHPSYQGKWHLSVNLDQVEDAIDAPFAAYRKIIETYGFQDFFGVGDINDRTLGGYDFDETTAAFSARWFRTKGEELRAAGKPWYLAVNFVNPHDVMFIDSDLPGETVQGKISAMKIARPPADEIYQATWDVDLPATRSQALDAPGRPRGQKIYQEVQDVLVGAWPDEDRRWRLLRDYYYNCIRDCDRKVMSVLEALKANRMDENTIIVFTADHRPSRLSRRRGLQGRHLADRSRAHLSGAHRRQPRRGQEGRRWPEGPRLLPPSGRSTEGGSGLAATGRLVQLQHAVVPGRQMGDADGRVHEDPRRLRGGEDQDADQNRARLSQSLRHPQHLRRPLSLQPLFLAD